VRRQSPRCWRRSRRRGFDLICLLDTLHDLGDPAAALAHARKALAPDGAVLVVEPSAADDYAANLANPMAALSYAASTFQCTPAARSVHVGRVVVSIQDGGRAAV
jgi:SAM-dependent methyltransferase